jgi:hypothetical protein
MTWDEFWKNFDKGIRRLSYGGLGMFMPEEKIMTSDEYTEMQQQLALDAARADPSLAGMSDRELLGLLDAYKMDSDRGINRYTPFTKEYMYDVDSVRADLERLSQFSEGMPVAPDLDAIRAESDAAIDAENADILAMYNADLQRRTDMFNQQMSDSNDAYNRNVGQILSNDYQKNAQLLGTMRSEMNRSQRNALEAGASAGIRIAGNINTMLSMQNKQSQQSLETSNILAQMLLNQQQANAGLRSEYGNYLSQDTANRAALKSGTVERKNAAYDSARANAYDKYDRELGDWENRYYAKAGSTNPFAESYRSNLYKSQYNTK